MAKEIKKSNALKAFLKGIGAAFLIFVLLLTFHNLYMRFVVGDWNSNATIRPLVIYAIISFAPIAVAAVSRTNVNFWLAIIGILGAPYLVGLPFLFLALKRLSKEYPYVPTEKGGDRSVRRNVLQKKCASVSENDDDEGSFYDELVETAFLNHCEIEPENMHLNRGVAPYDALKDPDRRRYPLIVQLSDGEIHLAVAAIMPGRTYIFFVAHIISEDMDSDIVNIFLTTAKKPNQVTIISPEEHAKAYEEIELIYGKLLSEAENTGSIEEENAAEEFLFIKHCELAPATVDHNAGRSYWEALCDRKQDYPIEHDGRYLAPLLVSIEDMETKGDRKHLFCLVAEMQNGVADHTQTAIYRVERENPYVLDFLSEEDFPSMHRKMKLTYQNLERTQGVPSTQSIFDQLLDENNHDPIVLISDGVVTRFEQVAIIPYEDKTYCILKPIDQLENVGESEAIVFVMDEDENGEEALRIEGDDEIAECIFAEYYRMLDVDEAE